MMHVSNRCIVFLGCRYTSDCGAFFRWLSKLFVSLWWEPISVALFACDLFSVYITCPKFNFQTTNADVLLETSLSPSVVPDIF